MNYLSQQEAQSLDEQLMGELGFSVDQLMELAGLSCASSLAAEYPSSSHGRVLVIAGPGNNGGDGLVAARHLHHFGYSVSVCLPKPASKPLYERLVTQCVSLGLPTLDLPALSQTPLSEKYDVVMDALFGFSFSGTPRTPYDSVLDLLRPSATPPVLVSVDIPSGWDVQRGPMGPDALAPDMLVSLTAPKQAAQHFKGEHHYVGGRFVPPEIRDSFGLTMPEYPGAAQCVKLDRPGGEQTVAVSDMRISYEKGALEESAVCSDPIAQFRSWFDEAVAAAGDTEPNAVAVASCDGEGRPSVRYVLLKAFDDRGFVFYTNYDSKKGRELQDAGHAAMVFYWEGLQRQVRVDGPVEKLSEAESTEYFHSRPRSSQIGAWVSEQSTVVPSRQVLIDREKEFNEKFADDSQPVPKPPHWGGFLVRPRSVEFWQGRPSRLHDRLVFTRDDGEGGAWHLDRLSP